MSPSKYALQQRAGLWAAVVCLLLFFFLAVDAAALKTPTADEPVHIIRGVALWHTRDLRLQTQPPLSHWLNHLFLWSEPTLPRITSLSTWPSADRPLIAHQFFWESGLAVTRVTFLARIPFILLSLLLGAVVGRWSRQLYGRAAALLVIFLFAFSPNLLAFAAQATTDLATTALTLATIYAIWRYQRRPSAATWLLAGLSLGLALATKVTTLILLPLSLLLLLLPKRRQPLATTIRPALSWASLLLPAALIFWALYQFELRTLPEFPWPLPAATYIGDFLHVQGHLERGHRAFLLGETSADGWWYYFVVAFLIKTPVPALILFATGTLYLLRRWRSWHRTAILWLPPISLFIAASLTGLNIGYRHILPVLPFCWLIAAAALPWWRRSRFTLALLSLLLAWYGVGTLAQRPHYLAFFNQLVGGSENGYRYLGDSNVDWGQDLNLLADYARTQAPARFHYSYFGVGDPQYYGLEQPSLLTADAATAYAPANPPPGQYALSANHVQGSLIAEPDLFDWFWRREPVANLGYSILLYDVPAAAPGSWVAHCLDPAPLLSPAEAEAVVGQQNLRHLYFDCRQSWVFPGSGASGWYLLPQQAATWPMAGHFPDRLEHVYAHAHTSAAPSYDVYYWNAGSDLAQGFPGLHAQARLPDATPVALPAPSPDANVSLLGYRQPSAAEWHTIWRVTAPAPPGLTLAAHLHTGADTPVIGDGLGFSSEQWQAGDIFVQYHLFDEALLAAPSPAFLATGVYSYVDGEPLPFLIAGRTTPQLHLLPLARE